MKLFDPKKVTVQKGINLQEASYQIEYLCSFVETFNDPLLVKIHAAILKSNFLSTNQIERIAKREDAISIEEINSPIKYLLKYWEILLLLNFAETLNKGETNHENLEKILSLRDFYIKFGYLTKKQINLIKFITPKNFKYSLDDHLSINFKRISSDKAYKQKLDYILNKFQPEILLKLSIDESMKFSQDIKCRLLVLLLSSHKTKKKIEKIKEEAQSIPQAFLSLKEMRNALQYVTK